MPDFNIRDGVTYLQTIEGELPLEIFGRHNLSNLMGAKWICQQMGVDEDDFFQAISCFKGASNRLEKVCSKNNSFIFKDFAHSPSKVEATVNAMKDQFDKHKIIACFELHTFSSLNSDFINEYKDTLSRRRAARSFQTQHTPGEDDDDEDEERRERICRDCLLLLPLYERVLLSFSLKMCCLLCVMTSNTILIFYR